MSAMSRLTRAHLGGAARTGALTAALVHLPADAPGAAEALDIDLSELAAQQPA